ncbi:PhzF family phenazine biosynthesis protein [Rhodoferax sp. OV413]|uniref:PhzF family phenazine biosynthesis protein n=1 Tax=Rhodoferax sp. OV413 TaxID=1855285 RepID=UPI0025E39DF4|nr:PhzF family phenazine biosynthesis protein [Rhodoferax sp. OV413]
MPRLRPFAQVDVFTAHAYRGNPLAVVLDAGGLSVDDMQRFARWTNLSETTFVLPPSPEAAAHGADYRVRIFTPTEELPFAGHPTLGSCHAWLQAGGQPKAGQRIVQECTKGLVELRRKLRRSSPADEGAQTYGPQAGRMVGRMEERLLDRLAFAAPALVRSLPEATLVTRVAAALGVPMAQVRAAQWLDNGPRWLGLLLDSPETVLGLNPDEAALQFLVPGVGVAGVDIAPTAPDLIVRSNREARAFAPRKPADTGQESPHASSEDEEPDLEVRVFAPGLGIREDPVTGSFNASLAQWLMADGFAPTRYVAAQGSCMGRAGRVYLDRDDQGQVWVGGDSVTCIQGTVAL